MRECIKIVVADDEPVALNYVATMVERACAEYHVVGRVRTGQEMLKSIEALNPDIVIADIHMPGMSGLQAIKLAREAHCTACFVMLTGYNKFDYAVEALRLGVAQYLLKPVDGDELRETLRNLALKIQTRVRQKRMAYIADLLLGLSTNSPDLLGAKTIRLVDVFIGSVTNRKYGAMSGENRAMERLDETRLGVIAHAYAVELQVHCGAYPNECVICALYENEQELNMVDLTQALLKLLSAEGGFYTATVSGAIHTPQELQSAVDFARETIFAGAVFGANSLLLTSARICKEHPPQVSLFAQGMGDQIAYCVRAEQMDALLDALILEWEKQRTTQMQLLTDIGWIMRKSASTRDGVHASFLEPLNLLTQCTSYLNLRNPLRSALGTLLLLNDGAQDDEIGRRVKKYLDEHFTQALSYKTLSIQFSYNEKYIASRFKAQYGVSPGKYILSKRIEKAKALLEENPRMLLKDVSYAVGFADPLYFSRVFHNATGESPSSFAEETAKQTQE